MSERTPCRNCPDRSTTCHVTCKRYSEYTIQNEKQKKKREDERKTRVNNRVFWGNSKKRKQSSRMIH